MMEAGTVFTAVSLMMLANGVVLAVASHDWPAALRPAAIYWQAGTMLIAAGCAVFAFGAPLPRPVMLVGANGFIVFGLTAYYAALQQFDGIRPARWQFLPAVAATACVAWFSTVTPNFQIRIVVVSVVWVWLLLASISTLLGGWHGATSLSRKILTGIFVLVTTYAVARLIVYLQMAPGPDFAVESGENWLNLLSPIFMTLLPVVGTTAFLLMCSDNLRRQLETAASTDYLTGLPNRRTLAKCGAERFRKAREHGTGLAVAVLDIDNFKAINDAHGHDVGDRALVHVAGHLHAQIRKADMIARTGGEEFAVLLADPDHAAAIAAVERMRRAVEQAQFNTGTARLSVTISAGVAVYRAGDTAFEDMLLRADQALYMAKSAGRNRVESARLALVPAQRAGTGDGGADRHQFIAHVPRAEHGR
ncbi:MAG TPA: GGDEF domain-containing protein [Mesorhizobium sp.]|nr:GGDEF domain-containing protein [Mesorhizobium sp.]